MMLHDTSLGVVIMILHEKIMIHKNYVKRRLLTYQPISHSSVFGVCGKNETS